MARFIPDRIGGVSWRPYKTEKEIDEECEEALRSYMGLHPNAPLPVPISTDVLTCLIEEYAERLDLYADMKGELEGLTEISPDRRPFVRINRLLSADSSRKHRLRSTLAHEFYHLYFHAPLYQEEWRQIEMFRPSIEQIRCSRSTILSGKQGDWREWQAAYGSGALLISSSVLGEIVHEHAQLYGHPPYVVQDHAATTLLTRVATCFEISEQAAMVRLSQKELLTTSPGYRQSILFPGEKASPS